MTSTMDIIRAKTASLSIEEMDIRIALEEVETAFRNHCNRSDIPNDARFVIANLAVDLIKSQHGDVNSSADAPAGELASISVDDVNLSFDANARAHTVNLDDLLLNYREQMNRFRKMRW